MSDNIILSFVEYDQFMIAYITSLIDTPEKGWILSFEVKIDDTNYLPLFPYQTVPEILDVLKDRDPKGAHFSLVLGVILENFLWGFPAPQ